MNKNILNDLLNTRGPISEKELNAYLDGSAPEGVRHNVENSMLDNPLYAEAVEGYQEMGLSSIPELESFSDFEKKLPALDKGAKIIQLTPAQKLLRVAAVAAVLLLAVFAYNAFQAPSPDSLYADFYAPYKNDISLLRRGDADDLNKDFKEALGLYAVGKFTEAMPGFEKALSAEPQNDAAHFFTGMACMETNQYGQAIEHLKIVKSNSGTYASKAYWYTILATLKSGDMESAKSMLEDYIEKVGYKKADAKKLMEQF
ncbi:MAG: tetratricopeptide repeat protein [Bacteroidota bacterium]